MRRGMTGLVAVFGAHRTREIGNAVVDALAAVGDGRNPMADVPLRRAALILLEAAGMIRDSGQGEWDLTERGREAAKRLTRE